MYSEVKDLRAVRRVIYIFK